MLVFFLFLFLTISFQQLHFNTWDDLAFLKHTFAFLGQKKKREHIISLKTPYLTTSLTRWKNKELESKNKHFYVSDILSPLQIKGFSLGYHQNICYTKHGDLLHFNIETSTYWHWNVCHVAANFMFSFALRKSTTTLNEFPPYLVLLFHLYQIQNDSGAWEKADHTN